MTANPNTREKEEVKKMFSRLAKNYDLANRLMCFGLDQRWRKTLAKMANKSTSALPILDEACGSGDVAKKILQTNKNRKVVASDFCEELLEIAKSKCKKFSDRVNFISADCAELPFEDESFSAITIAFGFRNFQDRSRCLSELKRVLKKGEKIFILEAINSSNSLGRFFMNNIAPIIATLTGAKKSDYDYLAKSATLFPKTSELKKLFEKAGFSEFKERKLLSSMNTVSIFQATKL